MTTVEMIHAEIDNATISMSNPPVYDKDILSYKEKAERLEKLGFTGTKEVIKLKEAQEQYNNQLAIYEHQKNLCDIAQYYQREYPFLKFLTEEIFETILEKYNLIHAPVSNYIESVPEKNLREIESAQPLHIDDKDDILIHISPEGNHPKEVQNLLNAMGHPDGKFSLRDRNMWLERAYNADTRTNKLVPPERWYNIDDDIWLFLVHKYVFTGEQYSRFGKITITSREGLHIAAPASHFNLEGLTQTKDRSWFKVREAVKDPIVFRYCRGGVQILSKWGKEAEDDSLILPITN